MADAGRLGMQLVPSEPGPLSHTWLIRFPLLSTLQSYPKSLVRCPSERSFPSSKSHPMSQIPPTLPFPPIGSVLSPSTAHSFPAWSLLQPPPKPVCHPGWSFRLNESVRVYIIYILLKGRLPQRTCTEERRVGVRGLAFPSVWAPQALGQKLHRADSRRMCRL